MPPLTVHPNLPHAPYELSLSDGVHTHGLRLAADEGVPALEETPQRASTLLPGSAGELQAHTAGLIHSEQRSWHAGHSTASWRDNPAGFAHSPAAWTLTPGKLLPAPRWSFADGMVPAVAHAAGNMGWRSVLADMRYLAIPFTIGSAGLTPTHVSLWLRRHGSPGTLRVEVWTDDGAGNPLSAIANASALATASTLIDTPSVWHAFELGTPPTLSASTTYHLLVYADDAPSAANHWAVGVDESVQTAQQSAAGSVWTSADFLPYFRVFEAPGAQQYQCFAYQGAFYAVVNPAGGGAALLYQNGARGLATAAATNTLTDSNGSWAVDHWAGAWVRISAGTGVGQARQIVSNTATVLSVAESWDETPDTSSQYAIYATPHWAALSAGFSAAVTHVAVANEQVFFAHGGAAAIRKMRYNTATPAHEFGNDTQQADRLHVFTDPVNGLQLWRSGPNSPKISRATPSNWGVNLSFGSWLKIGGSEERVTGLFSHVGQLWAIKPDGLWVVTQEQGYPDQLTAHPLGLDRIPDPRTGQSLTDAESGMVFSWGAGLTQLVKDSLHSLPPAPGGAVAALLQGGSGRLLALTAGSASAVPALQVYDGAGWHSLFSGWVMAHSPASLCWQASPGTHPRLWFSVGGELLFMDFPPVGTDPSTIPDLTFQHEAVLTLPEMALGVLRAPKFFKSFALLTATLAGGAHVQVEAQVDEEIGGAFWRYIGAMYRTPEDELPLGLGDVQRIRLRLRLQCGAGGQPPQVLAAVLAGFVRTPLKYRWRVQLDLDTHPNPAELLAWLKQSAAAAAPLHLRAIWPDLDGLTVIVEPPRITRTRRAPGEWGGRVGLTLREG